MIAAIIRVVVNIIKVNPESIITPGTKAIVANSPAIAPPK